MAVSPRMAICPGIILPEAVFNQQPITNIVFHIDEQHWVHYRSVRVANTVGSSLLRLQTMTGVTRDPILLPGAFTRHAAPHLDGQRGGPVLSSCAHSSEQRMTSRMRFCGMSAAVARFTCKFSCSNSLRGGMDAGVGESVNYAVMTSMGAFILQDNGPDAANAILREALSAQWRKQRQTTKKTTVIDDLSTTVLRRTHPSFRWNCKRTCVRARLLLSISLSSLYRLQCKIVKEWLSE